MYIFEKLVTDNNEQAMKIKLNSDISKEEEEMFIIDMANFMLENFKDGNIKAEFDSINGINYGQMERLFSKVRCSCYELARNNWEKDYSDELDMERIKWSTYGYRLENMINAFDKLDKDLLKENFSDLFYTLLDVIDGVRCGEIEEEQGDI